MAVSGVITAGAIWAAVRWMADAMGKLALYALKKAYMWKGILLFTACLMFLQYGQEIIRWALETWSPSVAEMKLRYSKLGDGVSGGGGFSVLQKANYFLPIGETITVGFALVALQLSSITVRTISAVRKFLLG